MLEALAIKLVTILAGYAFEAALVSQENINIQGAPGWYMKPTDEKMIWVYAMLEGQGLQSAEKMPQILEDRMFAQIETAMDTILSEQAKQLRDPLELEFVERVREDPYLRAFVRRHMVVHRNEYYRAQGRTLFIREARPDRAFGSARLPKEALQKYQRERLLTLARDITLHRAERGFADLEGRARAGDDPFAELPPSRVIQQRPVNDSNGSTADD